MRSSLADMKDRVIGGDYGCALSIGGYGFFAQSQFETQAKLLQELERINSAEDYFLSVEEWEKMDKYLLDVASFSKAYFDHVMPGDTFGVLAVKKNAFKIGIILLDNGLDPLVENIEKNDLFYACKMQYQVLTLRLKALNMRQNTFLEATAQIRQEWVSIQKEQVLVNQALTTFIPFLDKMKEILIERLVTIEADIVFKRRCDLLKEVRDANRTHN